MNLERQKTDAKKMNIYLSGCSPLNSLFMHESGQVLYQVSTPLAFGSRTSTIRKIVPNLPEGDAVRFEKFDIAEDGDDELTLADEVLRDKFTEWATIQHKICGSSVFKYDGQEIEVSSYFRKQGFSRFGRNRIFTAPDGREYQWCLEWRTSRLYLNDSAKTPVAEFHRKSFGIIGKKHPAYLAVSPAGLKIVDTIFLTFLYIEKKRKARERASRSNGGGGGP